MITRSTADTYRKIFIFTSIPFGLYMGAQGLSEGLWHGITQGVFEGLLFGSFMALILGVLHQISNKQLQSNYSEALLGVHQVQVLTLKQPFDEAFETCLSSIAILKKGKVTQQDRELGVIHAKTGTTWKSFGEKLMLTVSPDGDESCKVSISSKPLVGTTLVDYGKNIENIRSIVEALGKQAITTLSAEKISSLNMIEESENA